MDEISLGEKVYEFLSKKVFAEILKCRFSNGKYGSWVRLHISSKVLISG